MEIFKDRENVYSSRMETKHTFNRRMETTPEAYLTAPGFMVTAGGKYKFYKGENIPITYEDFFLDDAPWVYDIISRSSSILLFLERK